MPFVDDADLPLHVRAVIKISVLGAMVSVGGPPCAGAYHETAAAEEAGRLLRLGLFTPLRAGGL